MTDAIEHRQDYTLLAHRRGNSVDRNIEIKTFAAKQDDIKWCAYLPLLDDVDLGPKLAVEALDDEAIATELSGSLRPDEEGDVSATP